MLRPGGNNDEFEGQYIAAGYTGHGMPRAFAWYAFTYEICDAILTACFVAVDSFAVRLVRKPFHRWLWQKQWEMNGFDHLGSLNGT